jgi:two-component system chemotaxis response regulator CheB
MVSERLNILIVDDNLSYRKFLARVVQDIEGVELVPPAATGSIALKRMGLSPVDLVLLDLQMPEMSGLETLERIRKGYPEVGVIMISGAFASDADVVIRALEQGAIDFIPKSPPADPGSSVIALRKHLVTLFHQFQGRRNLNLAKRISSGGTRTAFQVASPCVRVPVAETGRAGRRPEGPGALTPCPGRVHTARLDLVVIGASTGGPNALSEVIPRLPADLGVPVLVVQHMPSFLTYPLARNLNDKSRLEVREAVEGDPLMAGTVYMAPGGRHLLVKTRAGGPSAGVRYLALGDGPPENSVRPSVDVLFRSVAGAFDGNVLAVIMTGMGNDGCKGVQALKAGGGYCVTQTAETCVVYGMPRAVDEAGLSDESVNLDTLAERIELLVKGSSARRIS